MFYINNIAITLLFLLTGCIVGSPDKAPEKPSPKPSEKPSPKPEEIPAPSILSLPTVGTEEPVFNKISANSSHIFVSYRIPIGGKAHASGLLIGDAQGQFVVISNFSSVMNNQNQSNSVPGFLGEISALAAFEGGAWLGTGAGGNAENLIAQIDNNGAFHNRTYVKRPPVIKIIPTSEYLIVLEYFGHNNPIFFDGNALEISNNIVNWSNSVAFPRTSAAMGDAAIDLIVLEGKKNTPLVGLSYEGLYEGMIGANDWSKAWEHDAWTPNSFEGGAGTIVNYDGKIALGYYKSKVGAGPAGGFTFCDLAKKTAPDPCGDRNKLLAKNHQINKMLVLNNILYLATNHGLLSYNNKDKTKAISKIVNDINILDMAIQDNYLWLITKHNILKFVPDKGVTMRSNN